MAESLYIGVNNVAKKARQMYIGDTTNISKKIAKMYMGDANGKAKLIYIEPDPDLILNPNSTSVTLSVARQGMAATSNDRYALFGGGAIRSGNISFTSSKIVDVYNSSLTRSAATLVTNGNYGHTGASNGNYHIFAGGFNGYVAVGEEPTSSAYFDTTATFFDNNMTSSNSTFPMRGAYYAGTNVNNQYAVFTGSYANGAVSSNMTVIYDNNKTKYEISTVGVINYGGGRSCDSIGKYVILTGGDSISAGSNVYAIDTDLRTARKITSLSTLRDGCKVLRCGEYILVAGGKDYNGNILNTVEGYNKDLTKISVTSTLNSSRTNLIGDTINDRAVFVGDGVNYDNSKIIEAFNPDLTKISTTTTLTTFRVRSSAAAINNQLLIAGGSISSTLTTLTDNVEVLKFD